MKENIASKTQERECKLHPDISCENCEENCPFLYCQHIDCMMCNQRCECPMCNGDCAKCRYSTYCKINF